MSMTIGFIGLGAMGKPMAMNLIRKGFPVIVRDVNPLPVKELVEMGAHEGKGAKEVTLECNLIITMLYNDSIAKEVILGEGGVMKGFRSESILIDMGTLSPTTSCLFAKEAKKRGGHYLSAPVTRGPKGAREGTLTIMVGGEKEVFERCLPVFQAMGKKIFHVGERPEMGHVFKLVNNFLSATHSAIAAEALAFGVKAGADPEKLFEVISEGSGNSYKFQLRVPNMLDGNNKLLTLPIRGLHKDISTVIDYAKDILFPSIFPVIAEQIYLDGIASGLAEKDPSALVELYERKHGISVKRRGNHNEK